MVSKQKACKHKNANNYDSPSKITLHVYQMGFQQSIYKIHCKLNLLTVRMMKNSYVMPGLLTARTLIQHYDKPYKKYRTNTNYFHNLIIHL